MEDSSSQTFERVKILKTSQQDDISEEVRTQKKLFKYYSKYSKYKQKNYSWPMKVFEGKHSDSVCCCSYSPDGNYLATGSEDKTVKIWNIKEQKVEFTLDRHTFWVRCCSYSPDGNYLATGSRDKMVRIWNIKEKKLEFSLDGQSDWINCCSYSPDGNYLAAGSDDNTVKIWNLTNKKEELTLHVDSFSVKCCSYSPDGNYLATGSYEKVKIWNIKERREEFTLNGHSDWVYCCSYSPDGNYLATGSRDKTVKIWNITERRKEISFFGHSGIVKCCSYSPDGKYLASGAYEEVKIWNIIRRREEFTLNGHSHWITFCSYSFDGNYLATGSEDKTVKIWNMKEQKKEFTLNGQFNWINYCTYSPDGDNLATGSFNKVKIWNIKEQREEFSLNTASTFIQSCSYSKNGKYLVTESSFYKFEIFKLKKQKGDLNLNNFYKLSIDNNVENLRESFKPYYYNITKIKKTFIYGLFTINCYDNGSISVWNNSENREEFLLCYDNSKLIGLYLIDNQKYLVAVYTYNIFKIAFWNKLLYILHDNLSRFIIERENIELLFKDAKVAIFINNHYNEYYESKLTIERQLTIIVSKLLLEFTKQKNSSIALNLSQYLVKFANLNIRIKDLDDEARKMLINFHSDTRNNRVDIEGIYELQILMFLYHSMTEFDDTQEKIGILFDQLVKIIS